MLKHLELNVGIKEKRIGKKLITSLYLTLMIFYSIIPDRHLSAQQLSQHDLSWDNIFYIKNN